MGPMSFASSASSGPSVIERGRDRRSLSYLSHQLEGASTLHTHTPTPTPTQGNTGIQVTGRRVESSSHEEADYRRRHRSHSSSSSTARASSSRISSRSPSAHRLIPSQSPSSSSSSSTVSTVSTSIRSGGDRFSAWQVELNELVGASPRRIAEAQRAIETDKGEEKQLEEQMRQQQHSRHGSSEPSHKAKTANNIHTNTSTVSGSQHNQRATASTAQSPSFSNPTAPNPSISRSLATLHKKVRPSTASTNGSTQSSTASSSSHPSSSPHSHKSNAAAFDRLYHGLSSVDPKKPINEPAVRNSVEQLEAAFLKRLYQMVPPPVENETTMSNPSHSSDRPSSSSRSNSRSRTVDKGNADKFRPSHSNPTRRRSRSPSLDSTEADLRRRATQLQSDLLTLAHKKRLQQLAEHVAKLRIEGRTYLEESEATLREDVDRKIRTLTDEHQRVTRQCETFEKDLESKLSFIQTMLDQVRLHRQQLEVGHQEALVDVQRTYVREMDDMNHRVTSEMEKAIHHIERQIMDQPNQADSQLPKQQQMNPTQIHSNGTQQRSIAPGITPSSLQHDSAPLNATPWDNEQVGKK